MWDFPTPFLEIHNFYNSRMEQTIKAPVRLLPTAISSNHHRKLQKDDLVERNSFSGLKHCGWTLAINSYEEEHYWRHTEDSADNLREAKALFG